MSTVTKRVQACAVLFCAAGLAVILSIPVAQGQGLIIDHDCTDIARVPDEWIREAKTRFRVGYGHTSHGSQLVTGMANISSRFGAPYDYTSSSSGLVPGRFLNDYWASGDLGSGGDLTWRDETVAMLNLSNNDRNVVMWSWCGGVSGNTAEGINTYLQAMHALEQGWPGITFIYMTGHLDGSGLSGNLHRMNELIRQFCRTNNKTLFDFADIESYDPDGNEFLSRYADDACNYSGGNWADEWAAAHPGDPLCDGCSCAHSRAVNCNLKGRAFWWMLARLAGWSNPDLAAPGNLSASDGTFSNIVQLSWDAVEGATGYEVWRHTSNNSSSALKQSGANQAENWYSDTNVTAGITYYYWVKALAGGCTSSFSIGDSGYCGTRQSVIGPVIKANGLRGNVSVAALAPLSIAIEMDPGDFSGIGVDWWVLVNAGTAWFFLDFTSGWMPAGTLRPMYQGGLGYLPASEVLNITGLGPGTYTFYFAVDYPMDGVLNLDGAILADAVTVAVE